MAKVKGFKVPWVKGNYSQEATIWLNSVFKFSRLTLFTSM